MNNELQKDDFLAGTKGILYYLQHPEEFEKIPTIHSTTIEDKNDLGNGWTNGFKDFAQAWQPTEDAEFEIIQPKQIENKP
jgi:hypothetical protein